MVIYPRLWHLLMVSMTSSVDARNPSLRVVVIAGETASSIAQILSAWPEHSGFAVIVLSPTASGVAKLLGSQSSLPVAEARGRIRLEPDRVLVIPPDCEATFQRNELVISRASEPRLPVDKLLRSLAEEYGSQSIAVLLRSSSSDGLLGVRRLKEAGGLTITEAFDDHTPRSRWPAADAGLADLADLVLPLPAISDRLATLARHPDGPEIPAAGDDGPRRAQDGAADTLQDMLVLVRVRTGHDFGSYKRATLYRRVSRRMQVCQCPSIAAYHQYLRDHPNELGHLMRDFLISVTNFFRDRHAFDSLETQVIPKLFAGKTAKDQIRIWVSGCATGEEAYSIGMLLCEHAGKLPDPPQLQIFATDIDEEALAEARSGRYPNTIEADVSPERLGRFFTQDGDHYRVSKELREIVLFSMHNVLRDPPFSRLDLVSCRNLLIYLNRDAQDRVLNVFHFALRSDGFLFLGSSESAENSTTFATLDAKYRLFMRRPSSSRLGSETVVSTGRWYPPIPAPPVPPPAIDRGSAGELHHRLVEQYVQPSVLVNEELDLLHVSEHAGRWLQLAGGEPSRSLLRLILPALRTDLRTAIYAARQSAQRVDTRIVRFDDGGKPRAVELRVRLVGPAEPGQGSLLVLFDELDPSVGGPLSGQPPNAALEPMVRDLEDELRRTRDQLRTTIEQYETSLEELKASNEELQAINEELRSATEELETSKEELQSVNEELTTLNHELKLKVDEISHTNSDLQNLMSSTEIGVVFLDRALHIKRFTPRAQDLFNLIPGDIGRPLAHVTHRIETEDLPQLAQSVLQTLRTVEREIRSRDGRRYLARLLPYRSLDDRIDGVVATFVDVTDLRNAVEARLRSEAALQASEDRLHFALRAAPIVVVSLDDQLRAVWGYVLGNELGADATEFTHLFAPGEAERFADIGRKVVATGVGQRTELDVVIRGNRETYDFRIEPTEAGINAIGFDITPSKRAEASLIDVDRRKDEFLATLSHELRNPLTPLKIALDIAKLAGDDPVRLEQSRSIMERQVAQLTQLVDDLLDLSRITQGKIELSRVPIDPALIVEAALETTRSMLQQRGQHLEVELPKPPCRVLGDPPRLTQVLINLLNNAAKYTPKGGHIELRLEADRSRGVLTILIRDDGQGISADVLPRIFDIFVQARHPDGRAHEGLGIGLNLVRRLVELHGGRVFATSAGSGHGSQFVVELPLAADSHDRSRL
jgi:two-component system CheB/CheR fusion protein